MTQCLCPGVFHSWLLHGMGLRTTSQEDESGSNKVLLRFTFRRTTILSVKASHQDSSFMGGALLISKNCRVSFWFKMALLSLNLFAKALCGFLISLLRTYSMPENLPP